MKLLMNLGWFRCFFTSPGPPLASTPPHVGRKRVILSPFKLFWQVVREASAGRGAFSPLPGPPLRTSGPEGGARQTPGDHLFNPGGHLFNPGGPLEVKKHL